jgi:hypothetical protein
MAKGLRLKMYKGERNQKEYRLGFKKDEYVDANMTNAIVREYF